MAELLTILELREHISTELGDDALERLRDACLAELERHAGALPEASNGSLTQVTETVRAYGRTLLPLSRTPASVVSVSDVTGSTSTALTTTDWRIRDNYLERTGGYAWGDRTVVTYVPADDRAIRRHALIKLVRLELNHMPGVNSQRIGDWSQTNFPGGASYGQEKAAILASVREPEWFA